MAQLRDYERAIIEVLSDGEEHDRQSLLDVGVRACSSEHALAQYQHENRDKPLQGESVTERLTALARQEVAGAKTLVGKAMSHLVDRKLMEPTQIERIGPTKVVRTHFRITEVGKKRLSLDDDPKALEEYERERASEYRRRAAASIPPEVRSARAKRASNSIPAEERSRRQRERNAQMTAAERSERSRKGAANRSSKERSATAKASQPSAEVRSERARRGARTRRSYFETTASAALAGLLMPQPQTVREVLRTKDPRTPEELFAELGALGRNDLLLDAE